MFWPNVDLTDRVQFRGSRFDPGLVPKTIKDLDQRFLQSKLAVSLRAFQSQERPCSRLVVLIVGLVEQKGKMSLVTFRNERKNPNRINPIESFAIHFNPAYACVGRSCPSRSSELEPLGPVLRQGSMARLIALRQSTGGKARGIFIRRRI